MATGTIQLWPGPGRLSATVPPALASTAAGRIYLLFDDTTDELVLSEFIVPADYASGMAINVMYSMVSATTNAVAIRTELMNVADTEDVDTDNFATLEASADDTVPGTAGDAGVITDSLGTPSFAAGDVGTCRWGRENGTSGTNATGDMEVWRVWLTYTTS